MQRLRMAGWLLFLTGWGTVMRVVIGIDTRRGVGGGFVETIRDVLEFEFGFWRDVGTEVRLRLFFHLVLFLAALVVGIIAALAGVGRVPLILVAAAVALSALPGVIWDYFGFDSRPPEAIRDLPIPVPGGRLESFLYLALAGAALAVALAARSASASASASPTVGPPSAWGGPPDPVPAWPAPPAPAQPGWAQPAPESAWPAPPQPAWPGQDQATQPVPPASWPPQT